LGNCGVELNAVLSFGRMTGHGLTSSDPLVPTSDPLVPTLVPGVSSLSDLDKGILMRSCHACNYHHRNYQKGSHHFHQQGQDGRHTIGLRGNHHHHHCHHFQWQQFYFIGLCQLFWLA
jgi:hypothetical protein